MLCPVSQLNPDEEEAADLFGPDDGWGDDAGAEPATPSAKIKESSEVRLDDSDAGTGQVDGPALAQCPRGMPSPLIPSPDEVARHWLTHLPYRSWCKWCVAAKRANAPHTSMPDHSKEIPLLAADYCYVRDGRGQDLLTIFVGRLYPSRAMFAVPCDVKGEDEYAIGRLAEFIKACGISRMVLMSDQEKSIGSMIEAAMKQLGGTTDWAGAVREVSAVGEL